VASRARIPLDGFSGMRTPTRIAPATNRGTSAVSLAWFLTSLKGDDRACRLLVIADGDADAVLHIVAFTYEQLSLNRFVLARHADVIMLASTIKAPIRPGGSGLLELRHDGDLGERVRMKRVYRKRSYPLDEIRRFLEPGPIVLVSLRS
jgi:hypothetical protein